MAAQNTETLLYQVDIQANNARLAELARDVRIAKEEFAKLQAQVKAGTADAALLDTANVKLKAALAAASQETRVLSAANLAQAKATAAATGSNDQLRAQLALATTAYNKLSVEERSSSEAGLALQAQTRALSDELKKNESAVGDNRRNVGNYAGAINELIPQLVKLQEQEKQLTAATGDNSAAIEVNKKGQIGFMQQLTESGTKAGLSADQINAKLSKTAEAIRPATAEIVKLEAEQAKVEAGTKAYTQIGFKIGQANKEVAKVTTELKQVEAATDGVKKGFDTVTSKVLGPFQAEIDKATGLVGKFKTGNELLAKGITQLRGAGETGSLGFKALASGIALTGIGLFVIAISAVVTYFTQSAEGGKILAQVMGGLGAVLQVATDLVISLGKGIVYAVTHPIEAIKQLGSMLTDVLLHPIDSGKRLGEAITGVANKTIAAAKAGAALVAEQKALVKARRELEIEDVKEQSRINVLLRLSKERGRAADDQLASLQEAGRLEAELTEKNIKLQERELAAIQEAIKQKGLGKAADLLADKAAKEKEIAQSLAAQDEVNAKIQVRESVFREKQRADARAASQKAREDAIKERIAQTETELLAAKEGSARELELKSLLVRQKAELEQAGEKKTAADRKLILAQSLTEQLKLDEEFEAKKSEAARKFLDNQLARDQAVLAADKKRRDDAAKEQEDSYQQNERLLNRHFARLRSETEDAYADGRLDKKKYDAQIELQEENRLGAELILLKQFGRDTSKVEEQIAKLRGKFIRTQTDEENKAYRERLAYAQQFGQEVGQLFAEALTNTGETLQEFSGKMLVLILNELETYILAQQAKAFARAVAEGGLLGIVEAGVESAAITVAFEAAKTLITQSTASAKPFNTGGIVGGSLYPNTPNQDSELTYLSKGEIVISRPAAQQFAPLLSYLNSLYGGANFAPGFTPATARVPGQIDGGLLARQLGGQTFDYDRFAAASANHPIDVNYVAIGDKIVARNVTKKRFSN